VSETVSLLVAFAAGLVSVLSPCVMPLMPAYLSLISGASLPQLQQAQAGQVGQAGGTPAPAQKAGVRRRVLLGCAGFVAGFSTVFVLLGATAPFFGNLLAFRGELFGFQVGLAQLAGLFIVLMGLHLAGALPIPVLYRDARFHSGEAKGPGGIFLMGCAFAFGWSPCIGPVLAAIYTLAGSRDTAGEGMALLAVYSLGLGVPFMLAGLSVSWLLRAIAGIRRWWGALEVSAGCLLVMVGVLVATGRLTSLNTWFAFLNDLVLRAEAWLL